MYEGELDLCGNSLWLKRKRGAVFGGKPRLHCFFSFLSILDCSTFHCTVIGNFFFLNAQRATDLNNNVVNKKLLNQTKMKKKTSDKETN